MPNTWASTTVEIFYLFVVCLGEGCLQNWSTPKPEFLSAREGKAVFAEEQQTQSPLHCWVTAASAEFTCSSKNSLLQVIFPSPPPFALKGLCSDLQIILLTPVEVGKLSAIVVLSRWCHFKFFPWFLTSLKCSVASSVVQFSELHFSMCFTPVPTLLEPTCGGVWGVVVLFYLHEMLLTKPDNHVFGKAVFYCFKQEAKKSTFLTL